MEIRIHHLSKKYQDMWVLKEVNAVLKEGGIYCLTGASGSGKTTLLHILMGIVKPDKGSVEGMERVRIGAVFQENRLCENLSPLRNILMVCPKKTDEQEVRFHMEQILPAECQDRPVSELSGGMKRRAAVLRAVLSDTDLLIMDEPFTGLDENTRLKVIEYILSNLRGRTLVVSTHQREDTVLLGAEVINM